MANLKKPAGQAVGHPRQAGGRPALGLVRSGEPAPDPPKGLLKKSRDRWFEFWRSDVAAAVNRDSDMGKLERWIRQCDEYERSMKAFRTARLVKGSMGQPTLNPLGPHLASLDAQISKAEEAYGMSPMARLKLGIALGEAQKSLADMNAEMEASSEDDDDDRLTIVKQLQG